jgi:hypothetical protein
LGAFLGEEVVVFRVLLDHVGSFLGVIYCILGFGLFGVDEPNVFVTVVTIFVFRL